MFISIPASLLILFFSFIALVWYFFSFKPQKTINTLVSQGVRIMDFKTDPNDDFYGIKKAIQEDPNMKAYVRKLPGKVALVFTNPDLVKEVLTNHNNYAKLNTTSKLNQILSSRSMINAEGNTWKLHRMILSEAFQYNFYNDMIPTIVKCTDNVIGFSSKKKKALSLPNHTELITAEVVTSIFFGVSSTNIQVNGRNATEELSDIIRKLTEYNLNPLRFLLGMWVFNFSKDYRLLKKRMGNFRAVFVEKIKERMQKLEAQDLTNHIHGNSDLLEILLQHRIKNNYDPEKTLSEDEILDNFFLFFVAGKDTTSVLISMALYACEIHPEWGTKLKKEVNETITTPENITVDLLNSMPLMAAFLNEVLRVFSPVPMMLFRIAKKDHYVGKIFVEKDTIVNVALIALNYNPHHYDNPEKFDPSRWLKDDIRHEGWKSNPFAFLPFSGGGRNCIGKHLGLIEAKVILSLILKNFELELDRDYKPSLANLGVAYVPRNQIPITLIPK